MIVKGGFVHVAFALIKRITIDMDMVGLPGTEHPEIEYQYIRGPYFSEDLKLIPEGVTCYENEHCGNTILLA